MFQETWSGGAKLAKALDSFLEENLQQLKSQGLYNEIDVVEGANGPEIQINGKRLINLSSNNYLGLATNQELKEVAKRAIDQIWSWSRSGSHN